MAKKKEKISKKRTLFHKTVNVFLYAGIVLLIILLLALGFSQTSTFREMLRDEIITVANKDLNGKLSIGKIDGTILSSLFLRNTVVSMGKDTLLNAGLIEVKVSPLQIFLKRIYIREIRISNTKIALTADSSGSLNISGLFPPSPKSTTHSKFPFKIIVNNLQLHNVNFSVRDYNKINSDEEYDAINMHDFRIKHINMLLSGLADIPNNAFEFKINKFSFIPNLKNFELKNLTGEFVVDTDGVYIDNLKILTGGTDLSLTAKIDNLNLFDRNSISKLGRDNIKLNLRAPKFDFDDLSSFVPSTGILKGIISVNLETSGRMNELDINRLAVSYLDTHLEAKGKIENLLDPDEMYINTDFNNTVISQPDIGKLLPSTGIPGFKNLGLVKFDTLNFKGNLLNFNTNVFLNTGNGNAGIKATLDFRKSVINYNILFTSRNLNLSPFTGIVTNLNSKGTIIGSGISTDNLNSRIKFKADGSSIYGNKIDTLRLNADANNKKLSYNLFLKSDTTGANLAGSFDFRKKNKPVYAIKGFVKKLNLADFAKDPSLISDMNFRIDGGGSDFDLDKLNLFFSLNLDPSVLRGVKIDSARAIIDIRSNDNGERVINIISDLADLTIIGKFSAQHSINLLGKEAGWIARVVKNKLYKIIYPDSVFNNKVINGITTVPVSSKNKIGIDTSSSFKYSIEFKNFDLLSLFMGDNLLSLNGNMDGTVSSDSGSVTITSNTNLDYLKFWNRKNVFFLSNLKLNMDLSNDYNPPSLRYVTGKLHLTADRIFAQNDFHNLSLDLTLADNDAKINFSGELKDKAKARLAGNILLPGNAVRLNLDTLEVRYNRYAMINKGNVKINYSRDQIKIDHFMLSHNNGLINMQGFLNRTGSQNLDINISNVSGKDISTDLLGMKPSNSLGANVHLNWEITGNFSSPVMRINFGADSVIFKNKVFGSLKSDLNYNNRNLSVDVRFLDSLKNNPKPALLITGNVPVDLSFTGGGDRFSKSHPIDLTLNAQDFNLATFGNIIPHVYMLNGKLTSNIILKGIPSDLKPVGNLRIDDIQFVAEANNLEYFAGLRLSIKDNKVSIDSMLIANVANTRNGGQITGSGTILLNNFKPVSMNISMGGTLKVLGAASKAVSPNVYGDLSISTDGNISFTKDYSGYFLNAPLIIKEAKLTFPPSQSAFENSTDNFIYRYVKDTTKKSKNELDFEKLIKLSEQKKSQESNENGNGQTPFNYIVNVKVQNEAVLKFVLSREINQNLTAVISGNLQYENIGGRVNSQGELSLLDGSTLDFLKTFEASGTIRFESELSNPYLNIVATYKNYYTPPEPDSKEEQVEVKIKLSGPLKNLSQNFIQNKNNISVYVGADNITNNKVDPTKDVSDAVMFILTGKFSSDLTQQQQSQALNQTGNAGSSGSVIGSAANSAAASLAGSLLGGVLNQYFGDYVRGVELRNVGSTTKFNLVGKVKEFRYSIGGSTDVFQDLSQANVRIEYPIFKNLLLRLERKEAITQTSVSNDMINELGLKYRFEF